MDTETQQQRVIGRRVKTMLLIFLIGMNGFFLFKFLQYKGIRDNITEQLAEDEAQIGKLESDLEKYVGELSKSKELNRKLNDLLKKTYEQLEAIKSEMGNYKGEGKDRLLKRISSTDEYLSKIDSLIKENQALMAENQMLRENIDTERQISKQLRGEKEQLEQQLMTTRFRTENIVVIGIKTSAGTREDPTTTASVIQKLKICFDIYSMEASQSSRRVLYVQINNPAGNVLSDGPGKDPRYIKIGSGKQLQYTTEMAVSQNTKTKNLCIYIEKDQAYEAGVYQLRFY